MSAIFTYFISETILVDYGGRRQTPLEVTIYFSRRIYLLKVVQKDRECITGSILLYVVAFSTN
jgi:hypothetical protein